MSGGSEHECSSCQTTIRQRQQSLECCNCARMYHRVCVKDMSQSKFFQLKKDNALSTWKCASECQVSVTNGTPESAPVSNVASSEYDVTCSPPVCSISPITAVSTPTFTFQVCNVSSGNVVIVTPSPQRVSSVASHTVTLPAAVTASTVSSVVSSCAILSSNVSVSSFSSTTSLCSKASPCGQQGQAPATVSEKIESAKYQCCASHGALSKEVAQDSCDKRQFTKLPFYEEIMHILEPTEIKLSKERSYLMQTIKTSDLKGWNEDVKRQMMSDLSNGKMQVLLRMCKNERGPQQDTFPAVIVKVNGVLVKLMCQFDLENTKVHHDPLDITAAVCHNSCYIFLSIMMSSQAVNVNSLISLVAVRPKTTEAMVKELNVHHPEHTRDLVKKHLGSNSDTDICTTSLRASLYCPIGKMRLTSPCRGQECSHTQCVDATTILGMMKMRPKLKCPVCDRPADIDGLYIDGLFKEILESVADSVDEVTFSKDGSWSCLKEKENCITIDDTLNQSVADISIIDLTETDTEATPVKKKPLADNTSLLNKALPSEMLSKSSTGNKTISDASSSCQEIRRVIVQPRPRLHSKNHPYSHHSNHHHRHGKDAYRNFYNSHKSYQGSGSSYWARYDRHHNHSSSSQGDIRSYGYNNVHQFFGDDFYSYDPQSLSRGFTLSVQGFSLPLRT